MSPDLEKLVALHKTDLRYIEHQAQIQVLEKECEEIEARYQGFASSYLAAKEKLAAVQSRCRQLELDLADQQQHHDKYKADLMKVRNQKEYEVALREIDTAKKNIGRLETEILEAMDETKRVETELGNFSPDIENKRRETDEAVADCRARQEELKASLEHMSRERQALEAAVSKPWLDRYKRVAKLRNGQALAEVVNGTCSSCRMTLRPQVFSEIRQGDVIYICDHCSRILYYIPETKADAADAS